MTGYGKTLKVLRKYRHVPKTYSRIESLTYTERLKKLKLPSLAHGRIRGEMIQTLKIIKGIEDILSERIFKVCTSSSTCGHSLKLEKPRCRTTIRLQQCSQRIINYWNSLPEGAVLAKDVNEFTIKIDQYWSHEVIYDY